MRCTRSLAASLLLTLVASAGACVHTQENRSLVRFQDTADVVVFQDVRVFAATGPASVEHQDVIVRGGVIAEVRETGREPPSGAQVIIGNGRTLMPGLVDAHVHAGATGAPPWYLVWPAPEHVLQELLYAGTTSFHDMGGNLDEVLALRARIEAGLLGPRMIPAGPILTAPSGYPVSMVTRLYPAPIASSVRKSLTRELDDPAVARATVNELAGRGVAFIKVALASTPDGVAVMRADVLEAITQTAHGRGLRVVAHIDTAAHALFAANHGVDVLVHGVHSSALTLTEATEIAAHGLRVVPTMLVFERLDQLRREEVALSPTERESVATNVQGALAHRPADYVLDAELTQWMTHLQEHRHDRLVQNTANLFAAGVSILVGTDGQGSVGSFPGGIHEEMRLLVAAGVPAADVLLGATSRAASMVLAEPTFGTLEAGKDADLLLLDGDPLQDISATARIVYVMMRGRIVERLPPPTALP